jgi:hypothetical protein
VGLLLLDSFLGESESFPRPFLVSFVQVVQSMPSFASELVNLVEGLKLGLDLVFAGVFPPFQELDYDHFVLMAYRPEG